METLQRKRLLEAMGKLKRMRKWIPDISGVPQGEFFMLHKIVKLIKEGDAEKPGVKISELSAATTMSKPAVSQMINSLEEKGLVERVTTKEDRRVVYVRLTQDGRTRLECVTESFTSLMDKIIEQLGEKDTEDLVRIFHKLYDILENIEKQD